MYTSTKLNSYPTYNTYMPQVTPARTGNLRNEEDEKYIVTTKIMVLALAVLFAVVFFVVCLHIYAKWIWSTSPGRGPVSFSYSFSFWPLRRRRNRASPGDEIVLDADVLDINMVMGLGKSAVEALPKFRYKTTDHVNSSPETGEQQLECPICLGKFEEDELGRALPKCGHSFHLECIDMWLYSHSTCPLCRAVLEPHEDESISLNFESPTNIQVFHLEPLISTPRRLRGSDPGQTPLPLPHPDQPPPTPPTVPESEQASQPAQDLDTANKRADSIPANVLFWGNHTEARLSTVQVNNNYPQVAPSQVAIDIDIHIHMPTDTDMEPQRQQVDSPNGLRSSSTTVAPGSRSQLHRLLGRGRVPAASPGAASTEEGVEMRVRPFRPSPWPSPSPAVAPAPSRLGGLGGVACTEEP